MSEMEPCIVNAAGWIPTSERLPGHDRGCVPFACSDTETGDEHWGSAFDADCVDREDGDGAWWCELCEKWIPARAVTFWYDIPPVPEAGPEREQEVEK